MAPKLVAITGASGFLGSHTIAALAEAGMNVRALTRSLPLLPPAETGFRPEVVPGDLSNHAALATLVDGADVVIHCAGAIKAKSRRSAERRVGKGGGSTCNSGGAPYHEKKKK